MDIFLSTESLFTNRYNENVGHIFGNDFEKLQQ